MGTKTCPECYTLTYAGVLCAKHRKERALRQLRGHSWTLDNGDGAPAKLVRLEDAIKVIEELQPDAD